MKEIKEKKISIIGAVKSGTAAAVLAAKNGAFPFVSDMREEDSIREWIDILKQNSIDYEIGGHTDRIFDCNLMIVSPGVPNDAEILVKAGKLGIEIISEIEFASWFCKASIIAITGTNGKTTTTSLTEFALNTAGKKAYAAGNIGIAFSEVVQTADKGEFIALEVSSFQLDRIKTFKPEISVMLNITPDHLDRYGNDFRNYIASKMNILKNQDAACTYIYNMDDSNIPEVSESIEVKKSGFSLKLKPANGSYYSDESLWYSSEGIIEMICRADELFIKGEHNIANALAVLNILKTCGADNDSIRKAFSEFRGVEHRIEYVEQINGIKFYNDSKGTNVDSVWYALRSFDVPLYLILGGKDKGNDYGRIEAEVLKRVKKIYAIGSSAQKVYDYFNGKVPVDFKKDTDDCVKSVLAEGKQGDVLLLSPACASFDMYLSYEDRGRKFKESVRKFNA